MSDSLTTAPGGPSLSKTQAQGPVTSNFRWVICGLLFFSTTVNYMDRQVISYLKEFFCSPVAQGGFGWTNSDFSYVTAFFTGSTPG
jgi:ACS family hexuronate transporter-like MFS transporter